MGAIQNSINQSIGAVMGGAVALEHVSEKIDTKTKEAANLSAEHQEEANKALNDIGENLKEDVKLKSEIHANEKEIKTAEKSLKDLEANKHAQYTEGEKKGKFMSKEDKKKEIIKRRHDLKKMQTAGKELESQRYTLGLQREAIKKNIDAINAKIKVSEKQLGRYGYKAPNLEKEAK